MNDDREMVISQLDQMQANQEQLRDDREEMRRAESTKVTYTTAATPPDPVLWFPGGDAECGTNAGRKFAAFLYV